MKPFVLVLLIGIAMIAFVTIEVVDEGRIRATTESGELTMAEWPATVGRPARKGSLPAVVARQEFRCDSRSAPIPPTPTFT